MKILRSKRQMFMEWHIPRIIIDQNIDIRSLRFLTEAIKRLGRGNSAVKALDYWGSQYKPQHYQVASVGPLSKGLNP